MQEKKSYWQHLQDYLRIVWFVMINLLSFVFISLADKLMIGRLGAEELVGANSVNLVAFIPILLSVGCSTVLPSIVASGDVRHSYKEATQMLYTLLIVSIAISVVFVGSIPFAHAKFLQDMPPSLFTKVRGFFWAVSISTIFSILIQPLRKYMEGLGWFRLNMSFSLLGGIANILLNYLFIYGLGGIPPMGVTGAGIATLIVRMLSFSMYVYFVFFMSQKQGKLLAFRDGWLSFDTLSLVNGMKMSLPGGIELFARGICYWLADWMLYQLYADCVHVHAAGTILFDIIRYTSMISLAAAITSTILIGRAFGMGDRAAQLRIGLVGYGINSVLALLAGLLGWVAYPYILAIMQYDATGFQTTTQTADTTKAIVGHFIRYAVAIQMMDSLNVLGICLLRGRKDVVIPVVINVLCLAFVGLPTSFLLGITYQLGLGGILLGLFMGLALAAFGLFIRFGNQLGLFKKTR